MLTRSPTPFLAPGEGKGCAWSICFLKLMSNGEHAGSNGTAGPSGIPGSQGPIFSVWQHVAVAN